MSDATTIDLSGFHVGPEDIDAFASAVCRPRRDLQPLLGLEFTRDVWAVADEQPQQHPTVAGRFWRR